MPATVEQQNFVIHALHTNLDLCDALPAQLQQTFERDKVRAGFDDQPNIAMDTVDIARLYFSQRDWTLVVQGIFLVERFETAANEPLTVVRRIR